MKITHNYFLFRNHLFVKCLFLNLAEHKYLWGIYQVNEPIFDFRHSINGKYEKRLYLINGFITLRKFHEKYFAHGFTPLFYRNDSIKPIEMGDEMYET